MFGFTNSTPTYQGNGQPTTSSSGGFLSGLLGYLFGGVSTPSYKSTGQTGQTQSALIARSPLFGNRTPAYKAAPSTVTQTPAPTSAPTSAPDDDGPPDGTTPGGCAPDGGDEPPIFVCIR